MTQPRRPVLGISGWVLAVCIFLPTLRVCGHDDAPIMYPPVYGFYIGAVIVGLGAFARTGAGKKAALFGLTNLWLLSGAALLALWLGAELGPLPGVLIGIGAVFGCFLIGRALLRAEVGDRAFSVACIAHGLLAMGWNALLAFDPEGLWGAQLALAASAVMVVASLIATADGQREARNRDHAQLPEARLIP